MLRSRPEALAQDRAQDAQTVANGMQVAHPVDPRALEARHLRDHQAGLEGANVQLRLDLEPLGVDGELGQAPRPESVVAVAEVGVVRAEQQVDERGKRPVSEPAHARDVGAAPVTQEARPLREIGAAGECFEEARDLLDACRAVGVEHDDDLRADRGETGDQSVPLPSSRLADQARRRPQGGGDLRGPVDRLAVNDHDLVLGRDLRQHVRQVRRLVERRDDDAYRRRPALVQCAPCSRGRGCRNHEPLFLCPIARGDRSPQVSVRIMSRGAEVPHPAASGSKIRRDNGCGSPWRRRRRVPGRRGHL